ncbi:O-antigen ligase family protein [Erythrobacter sp. NFXS35]|uniref:O-antigen ligase family protein n=1 Tax=Erythrobacter sp. NFXS35 TaxID=2818436 RepID=UPI0032E021D8
MNSAKQFEWRSAKAGSRKPGTPAPHLRWVWIGLFVAAIALLGGSSRPDPIQHALLRPLAALFLIPALYHLRLADLGRVKVLAALLDMTLVWMIIQLVPLPPELWQGLPGRGIIAEIDQLAGIEAVWRPLSLAPFRGLNSALGMVIPITALLLALSMKMDTRLVLLAIVAIGLVDAAFGMLQVIGGPRSPLYLFAIASRGAPAGIFANENHSAVFSALALLTIVRLSLELHVPKDPAWLRLAAAPAFVFILLAVLVTGSRAGYAATLVVLVASGMMALLNSRKQARSTRHKRRRDGLHKRSGILALIFAASLVLVVMMFVWLERTPALQDMLTRSSFEDLRWSLWPVLAVMIGDHWLLGTGFGSFDAVYHFYEPTALLLPRYVNHAHNDWAQLVIEGGLPAIMLLAAGLVWLGNALWIVIRKAETSAIYLIFWMACIAIIGAASIVDYPLRTPIFQTVFVWLFVSLALDKASVLSKHQSA